jgi:flagella basal body P-ring formation protein FlgA
MKSVDQGSILRVAITIAAFSVFTVVSAEDNLELPPPPAAFDGERPSVDISALVSRSEQNAPSLPAFAKLQGELMGALRSRLPEDGREIVISNVKLPANLELDSETWEATFDFRMPSRGVGTAMFSGAIVENGWPGQRFTGSVMLDRKTNGVQVNRLIRRGERVGPDDITVTEGYLSQIPNDAIARPDDIANAVARREIRPGAWITGRMFELPTLVRNRQIVTLKLVNGPILIEAKGVAKQEGALGDVIRVQNVSSKRDVLARVTGTETVEVVF